MLHPLPCLITFNIVGYINERELNNYCGVSSICNSLHIELHLICSIVCCILPCHASLNRTCIILVCASCHVYVVVVYYVVCFFPGCFSRQLRFRSGFVRIRSTTSVCLLHGLVLLPSGISGKMTITLDITSIFACQLLRSIAMLRYLSLVYHASHIDMSASNLFTLPSKPLFGYVTALLSPSYSVVSCR